MTKVFIGMPAYNGERFISQAIESLCSQTFTDWTLLISDDASTDNTESICKNFSLKDPRISYVKQEKIGMDSNFTYLVEKADAHIPYFMWAGQDDIWKKDFLKTCVDILDNNTATGVAFTGMTSIDSYGRTTREYKHFPSFSGKASFRTVTKHLLSPEIMGRGNLMYALIRTPLAKKVNKLYPNKLVTGADVAFAMGIVAHGGVLISKDVLFQKRQGGFSDPDSIKKDTTDKPVLINIGNPKNGMFPLGRFWLILSANLMTTKGTPYKPLVIAVFMCRLPRAIFIYLRQRNYKKFIQNKLLSRNIKKTITTRIQGGLGNQLFQYALGRKLAILHNAELKLDVTLFDNYIHHGYSISNFNIVEAFATKKEINSFKRYKAKDGRRWFLYNFIFANKKKYIQEKQFEFNPAILKTNTNTYLDGYWQTEKYFKDIEDVIRREFTIKTSPSDETQKIAELIKKQPEAVSLHVRRGNYVTNKKFNSIFGSCPIEYYQRAINYMSVHLKKPHFFVFSNDHEWARENIRPNCPVTYIEHTGSKTDYEDIVLISMCKHHILANSTFSWWGAWLNPSKDKLVVGPEKWFETKKYNTKDILPESWVKL